MYIEWWMFLAIFAIVIIVIIATKPQPRDRFVAFYEEINKSPMLYKVKEKTSKIFTYQLFNSSLSPFCSYSITAERIVSNNRKANGHIIAFDRLIDCVNFTKVKSKDSIDYYYSKKMDMYIVIDRYNLVVTKIYLNDSLINNSLSICNALKEWNRWGHDELEDIYG